MRTAPLLCFVLPLAVACDDVKEDGHTHDHNHGLTTALLLHFTDAGGTTTTFGWEDPENDGVDVKIDDVVLASGESFALELEVLNQLETPVEDVTEEILEHAEEHQFFFTGSAVEGPASASSDAVLQHAYADTDPTGLPVGITNTITTVATGTGELVVTLRHLPPEGDVAVKTADLAEQVRADGFSAIGGDNDIQVSFAVQVD